MKWPKPHHQPAEKLASNGRRESISQTSPVNPAISNGSKTPSGKNENPSAAGIPGSAKAASTPSRKASPRRRQRERAARRTAGPADQGTASFLGWLGPGRKVAQPQAANPARIGIDDFEGDPGGVGHELAAAGNMAREMGHQPAQRIDIGLALLLRQHRADPLL